MQAKIIYLYDALCGWCYGFSPVIRQVQHTYASLMEIEVISGGMILDEQAGTISPEMSRYILGAIPRVESITGVSFGEPYRQQLADGSLYQSSLTPSIALSICKQQLPGKAVDFAAALQKALFSEGLSLEADTTYHTLATEFGMDGEDFVQQLATEEAGYAARQDFDYAAGLGVTGFPALIGLKNDHYYWLSKGFQPYEQLQPVIEQFREA